MRLRPGCVEYTAGWICALPLELAAGKAMLDEMYDAPAIDVEDSNAYVFGRIDSHKVVMACLPRYGLADAATVASHMNRSFPSLQLRFMVGIGGGVPRVLSGEPIADVRLGDVVIGTKVEQYDLGKTKVGGDFRRTSKSSTLPNNLETAVQKLRAYHEASASRIAFFIDQARFPPDFHHPGVEEDLLFSATYDHDDSMLSCKSCDRKKLVARQPRSSTNPVLHYGVIASGNQVMKDGCTRDRLASELDAVCFEMEAAGFMNHFPCLVVRGICDYSDSHKMKGWQRYAAATASAYVKELLYNIPRRPMKRKRDSAIGVYSKEHEQCIADLRFSEPRDDKIRIEQTKGGLLTDAYKWIMSNSQFQEWQKDANEPWSSLTELEPPPENQNRLLWIGGDPGKGKTMLACGLIDELSKNAESDVNFFFCQATDVRFSSATSVIRGLMYQVVSQQPHLMRHLIERYRKDGKELFEGVNSWTALTDILSQMCQDSDGRQMIMVVDALDECTNPPQLVEFITASQRSRRVRWIVTSRNSPSVTESFALASDHTHLSLELNESSVREAVCYYIRQRVDELARMKRYNLELKLAVENYLSSHAQDTFLWVALVCANLRRYGGITYKSIMRRLNEFPPGLNSLYQSMLVQIDKDVDDGPLCRQIIAKAVVAERPLALEELRVLLEYPDPEDNSASVIENLIPYCGCCLIARQGVIYFVHQSAKEYFSKTATATVFPEGIPQAHRALFLRSVELLRVTLRRDIYHLAGTDIESRTHAPPRPDPLATVRYSIVYWIRHLNAYLETESDNTLIPTVVQMVERTFLYWVEALSHLESLPIAIHELSKLTSHFNSTSSAGMLIRAALQFLRYHRVGIEADPLQTYLSALIFSPEDSEIRRLFKHELPDWVDIKPATEVRWPRYSQTLEGDGSEVLAMTHDPNNQRFSTFTKNANVNTYDFITGACLSSLQCGGASEYMSATFISDGNIVAFSLGRYERLKIVNLAKNQTISFSVVSEDCPGSDLWRFAMAPDGSQLATRSVNRGDKQEHPYYPIYIKNGATGAKLGTLKGHRGEIRRLVYISDKRLLSGSRDRSCKLWDTSNSTCMRTFLGHSGSVDCIASVPDGLLFASGSSSSRDQTVKVWNIEQGSCLWTIDSNLWVYRLQDMSFSADQRRLAIITGDWRRAMVCNTENGAIIQTVSSPTFMDCIALAGGDQRLTSGMQGGDIQIWDTLSDELETREEKQQFTGFLYSGTKWVSQTKSSLEMYDTATKVRLRKWDHLPQDKPEDFAFAPNGKWLIAYQRLEGDANVWCLATNKIVQTFGDDGGVYSVAWFPDSQRVAIALSHVILLVCVWSELAEVRRLESPGRYRKLVLSRDGRLLASVPERSTKVKIWDINTGTCLHTVDAKNLVTDSVAFSHDGLNFAIVHFQGPPSYWSMDGNEIQVAPDEAVEKWYKTYLGSKYGLDKLSSASWVTSNGRKLIWLPPEFRPSSEDLSEFVRMKHISGDKKSIAIHSRAGHVYQIKFKE
ncbi:hypothetical protein GGR57DRAFT_478267 [Xylariaceae sp. FL1272]|nr:hypothetical protein GGR57DRAFT_478267 [Xylariaceae sp. FL1272]